MNYEEEKIKKTKVNPTKIILGQLERVSTGAILWFLIRRHKVGLLATWAVVMTALYVFPPLPDVLLGLLGR